MSAVARRRLPQLDLGHGVIDMSHGGGGRATAQLVEQLFLRHLDNDHLRRGNDFADFDAPAGRLVMSVDSHVIAPLFFPGGDIGSLAVHGTVNDIAMSGARPLYLTAGFILEEGFALADLDRIVASMARAARDAGVTVIAGDTKVVERGKGDGVFITTTGVGVVAPGVTIAGDRARPGDAILVSGAVGDHGVAIMSRREGLSFDTDIQSDAASLHELVAGLLGASVTLHCLRDPTRGGVATALNEIASQSGVGMTLDESRIPVAPGVRAACELLGLDPLYVANEGKLLCICPGEHAQRALAVMHAHPLGASAAVIGEVVTDPRQLVTMRTGLGGSRVLDWLSGEQLPRIC